MVNVLEALRKKIVDMRQHAGWDHIMTLQDLFDLVDDASDLQEVRCSACDKRKAEIEGYVKQAASDIYTIRRLSEESKGLQKLCGISAAIIRQMELTAKQIRGSHAHVHALREAAGESLAIRRRAGGE